MTYPTLPDGLISPCWAWVIDDNQWRLGGHAQGSAKVTELPAVLDALRITANEGRALRIVLQDQLLAEHLADLRQQSGSRKTLGDPEHSLMEAIARETVGREVEFAWVGSTDSAATTSRPWLFVANSRQNEASEAVQASTDLRHEIVGLETSLLSAESRNDVERLEQMIHHDFYEIGRTGRYWERDDVIRVLNTIPDQIQGVAFDRVVELAPGVAHVRFRTEDALGTVHRSSIWMREGDHWQQRYHQGTPDTQAS
ncbi:DUF4440 domain-containing protein [Paeniglutamicibacter kerguelensis]